MVILNRGFLFSHLIVTGPARGRLTARDMMAPSQGGDLMSTPIHHPGHARSSLSIYLQEIGRYAARGDLVTANLAFVVRVARRYSGLGVALEDLISEGNLGLL